MVAIVIGSIMGGLTGGFLTHMFLSMKHGRTNDSTDAMTYILRGIAYSIGGMLFGVVGGAVTEVLVTMAEK